MMAVQFTDFLHAPRQSADFSGISDALGNVLQGYRMQREPTKIAQEEEHRMRQNALDKIREQFMPKEKQAALAKARLEYDPEAKAEYIQGLIRAFGNQPGSQEAQGDIGGIPMNEFKNALIRQSLGIPSQLPQEKLEMEEARATAKENLKRMKELEKAGRELREGSRDVQAVEDVLTGPKTITGWGGLAKNWLSQATGGKVFGDEAAELAKFNSRATKMQAKLARLISTRGGAVAAQLAAQGKPSARQTTEYNRGLVRDIKSTLRDDFNDLKREYEDLTGREYPYSLDDVLKAEVSKHSVTSHIEHPSSFKDKQHLQAYYNSLSPEEKSEFRRQLQGGK